VFDLKKQVQINVAAPVKGLKTESKTGLVHMTINA
jgi:hypothetical protein